MQEGVARNVQGGNEARPKDSIPIVYHTGEWSLADHEKTMEIYIGLTTSLSISVNNRPGQQSFTKSISDSQYVSGFRRSHPIFALQPAKLQMGAEERDSTGAAAAASECLFLPGN